MNIFDWTRDWARGRSLKVWSASECGSTNTQAKDDVAPDTQPILLSGAASLPTLYLTANQTRGRGRGDHVWTMPPGSSLLSSWSFAMAKVPQPIFSPLAGLALYESVAAVWPEIDLNLKAPNDLYIGRRKTAGLLIETVDRGSTRHTVVGLGLNVAAAPSGLETATCLAEHWAHGADAATWSRFLDGFLDRLRSAVQDGQRETLSNSARARLLLALNKHPLLKEPILDVDELGQLRSASRVVYWHEL